MSEALWHDIECGAYTADLPLWCELARDRPGPVLDVGAGTGRVALELASRGHEVVAFDIDPELLAELERRARAQGVHIETRAGDAAALDVGRADFSLILVPMQTIQLLRGAHERLSFLRRARTHLRRGGTLAAAIVEEIDPFDASHGGPLPDPDRGEHDGAELLSRPLAVVTDGGVTRLERLRETVRAGFATAAESNVVELAVVDAAMLAEEARVAGFAVGPPREIPPTDVHIGSTVVMFDA